MQRAHCKQFSSALSFLHTCAYVYLCYFAAVTSLRCVHVTPCEAHGPQQLVRIYSGDEGGHLCCTVMHPDGHAAPATDTVMPAILRGCPAGDSACVLAEHASPISGISFLPRSDVMPARLCVLTYSGDITVRMKPVWCTLLANNSMLTVFCVGIMLHAVACRFGTRTTRCLPKCHTTFTRSTQLLNAWQAGIVFRTACHTALRPPAQRNSLSLATQMAASMLWMQHASM